MRRIILLAGLLLLATIPSGNTSSFLLRVGSSGPACNGYTGPGDVVASATVWYGLRGYSCATSTGLTKAVQLRRVSDSTTQDIVILKGGALDTASADTFGGVDATCNASISGTTMTLQSGACSSVLNAFDTLTFAGATYPVYITSIGTCGSNTIGNTCTLNQSQGTIATTTITAHVQLTVAKWYDQTSGNKCNSSTTCDASQASTTSQPQFLSKCLSSGTLPCMMSRTSVMDLFAGNSFTPNAADKATYSAVANRVAGSLAVDILMQNGNNNYLDVSSTANVWLIHGGAGGTLSSTGTTAADNAWHTANAVANGASSVLNIDGTEFTGTVSNNNTASGINVVNGNVGVTLLEVEAGFWDNFTASSGQRQNLCHNQATYYGTTMGAAC